MNVNFMSNLQKLLFGSSPRHEIIYGMTKPNEENTLSEGRNAKGIRLLEGRTLWGEHFLGKEHFGENTFQGEGHLWENTF